jgi:hypothetical protein
MRTSHAANVRRLVEHNYLHIKLHKAWGEAPWQENSQSPLLVLFH